MPDLPADELVQIDDAGATMSDSAEAAEADVPLGLQGEGEEPETEEPEELQEKEHSADLGPDLLADADTVSAEPVGRSLSWLPFILNMLGWIVLAAASAYLLRDATAELPARWMPVYEPLMWSGVSLTILGPVLALGVWLAARASRSAHERNGLLSSAMARGALVTLLGVIVWFGTLYVLDLHAAGRFL